MPFLVALSIAFWTEEKYSLASFIFLSASNFFNFFEADFISSFLLSLAILLRAETRRAFLADVVIGIGDILAETLPFGKVSA